MVAKDPGPPTERERRGWVKVKGRYEDVFVVAGIRNVDAFDGVLVGRLINGRLEYRGCVEWGYLAADVLAIIQHARDFPWHTSPFVDLPRMRSVVWMQPRLRAEISYAEIVGGRLRAPPWRRLISR